MRKYLFLIFVWSIYTVSFGDDYSARRFVFHGANEIVSKYYLIATPEVQKDLLLEKDQIDALSAVFTNSIETIPGIKDLRSDIQKKISAVQNSDQELQHLRAESRAKTAELLHVYASNELARILSQTQNDRLQQLFFQMCGPKIILKNQIVRESMCLSESQVNRLGAIVNSYDAILSLLEKRSIAIQLNTVRRRESSEIIHEKQCIQVVGAEIEKDMDSELLSVLTAEQKNNWCDLIGDVLPVHWNSEALFELPFQ